MFLSDAYIDECVRTGVIGITPYDKKFLQPASYDLHLSRWFRGFLDPVRVEGVLPVIDVIDPGEHTLLQNAGSILLRPGDFVLASTIEKVRIPNDIKGTLEGKSSLGRLGLTIHVTAGFFDPGFTGHVTLEIANLNKRVIKIRAGMPIAQMSFSPILGKVSSPYGSEGKGSKYQHQSEKPSESKFWKNYPDNFLENQS